MKKLIDTILTGKRRRFLRSRPIYETTSRVTEMELLQIAQKLDCKMALGLSKWLLSAGYGNLEQSLSFHRDWFCLLDNGPLQGNVAFAHDDMNNIYAYDPRDSAIYFVNINGDYARLADDFTAFMQELVRRDYNLAEWRNSLTLQHHEAAAA
jgi:hypothetical protein